jgi:hypothetical protein
MAKGTSNTHTDILRYALPHLEQERDRIQAQIDHIHRQLGQKVSAPAAASSAAPASAEAPAKKRVLSVAARKRIAAAQKKRWAEHRKAQAKAGKSE